MSHYETEHAGGKPSRDANSSRNTSRDVNPSGDENDVSPTMHFRERIVKRDETQCLSDSVERGNTRGLVFHSQETNRELLSSRVTSSQNGLLTKGTIEPSSSASREKLKEEPPEYVNVHEIEEKLLDIERMAQNPKRHVQNVVNTNTGSLVQPHSSTDERRLTSLWAPTSHESHERDVRHSSGWIEYDRQSSSLVGKSEAAMNLLYSQLISESSGVVCAIQENMYFDEE